jgi:hypothetical protein
MNERTPVVTIFYQNFGFIQHCFYKQGANSNGNYFAASARKIC